VGECMPMPKPQPVVLWPEDMQRGTQALPPAEAASETTSPKECPGNLWEDVEKVCPRQSRSPESVHSLENGQMTKSDSLSSQRSIMGGVQRRIKALEERDLGSDQGSLETSPKTRIANNLSDTTEPGGQACCVVGLPCLIMSLVAFSALSSSLSMIIVLEVIAARGALSQEDFHFMRVVDIVVCVVATVTSLILAYAVTRLISHPLKRAAKIMEFLGRPDPAGESGTTVLKRASKYCMIRELRDMQAASSRLLGGIDVFKRYLPETVVQDVINGDDRARRLHVSSRQVTIMFSDIKDFTSISEKLTHTNLLFLLTRYLSVMTRIVEAYEGVVAEILGDGLLVFFNTPDDVQHHAAKASASALAMCEALDRVNEEFTSMGLPRIGVRVGLHTGVVLTGNIGSERKMKFGCMGDPVNLASRLEGLCKVYGVSILCSGDTHHGLPKESFCCRQLDLVQVKGKHNPTRIYEVMGLTVDEDDGDDDTEDAGATRAPTPKESGRFVLPCSDVAKQALSDSAEAIRARDVQRQNPFLRMAKVTVRRLSGMGEAIASPKAGGDNSYPVGEVWKMNSEADRGSQVSFNVFARTLSQKGRSEVRTRGASAEDRQFAADYEKALLHYQHADFVPARDMAKALLVRAPRDTASALLLERASRYIGPDGAIVGLSEQELQAWTGLTVMTEK